MGEWMDWWMGGWRSKGEQGEQGEKGEGREDGEAGEDGEMGRERSSEFKIQDYLEWIGCFDLQIPSSWINCT